MAQFQYVDTQGNTRTVEAQTLPEARSRAMNIAPTSGLQLLQDTSDTINLGQIDTTAVPLPNSALETPVRPLTTPPQPFATVPEVPQTEEDRLISERQRLQSEISTLEGRITGRSAQRETALGDAGVFEDVRRLNELRAEDRRLADREIEIPIEGRQALRGRRATRTEFSQLTTPQLERNALESLAASRATSRLTDTINTNIALIDQRINAEKEADEFIYTARQNQLETIESAYSTLLSDQQALALEEQKTINANLKAERDAEWRIIEAQARIAEAREDFTTAAAIVASGSADEAYRLNAVATGNIAQAARDEAGDKAVGFVDMIDGVLNAPGISGAVGATWLGRGLLGTTRADFGKEGEFLGKFDQLLESLTNQAIIDMRAQATGLGTFTDKDRDGLANAQIAIAARERGERINMSETAFKEALEAVKRVQMNNYIHSKIGDEAFRAAGWRDKPLSDIQDFFELKRAEETATQSTNNPYANDFGTVSSVIRQEEGFSTTAYPDAGGYSIGFGSQTLDGQPVRPGQTISPQEAEALLAEQIARHSNYLTRVTRPLTATQKAALASFEYNLGPAIWNDPDAAQILALVNSGQLQEAGRQMALFNRSLNPETGQREINPVLVARRGREANLLLA